MYNKFKNINNKVIKFASIVVIAGSVSLVSNIDIVNATPNPDVKETEYSVKEINGWKMENNKWYYYENSIKKTGWLKENNKWYWLKSNGEMGSNEWYQDTNGGWYWLKSSGAMGSNEWYQDTNGGWYWLKSSGAMASNEWYQDTNGGWYWLKSSGAMASNEWYQDTNGGWYWLKSSGTMASNEWYQDTKGSWYWLKSSGAMASNEWHQDGNGGWYWLKSNGTMASNELIKVDNKWYKFRSNGSYEVKNHEDIATVNQCDFLNIRSGASINDEILGCVYTREYVEILEKENNGWYKIQSKNATIGWVSSKYITVQSDGNIDSKIEQVIEVARKQLGKPYVWGASGPNSFDCSGLTSYSYKQGANVTLPRVSKDQGNFGTSVSRDNLKAGDLIFFASDGRNINHVALYIGNSEMIHSPRSGDVVKIDKITSSYCTKNYYSVRRVIN